MGDSDESSFALYFDFQWNALKEAALGLYRAVSMYLAVTVGVLSYLFVQTKDEPIPEEHQAAVIYVLLVFAILTFLACGSVAWGIWKGLQSVNSILKEKNAELYKQLRISDFVTRGRNTVAFVAVCAIVAIGFVGYYLSKILIEF